MFGNDNDSLRADLVQVDLGKASSFPSGEILARRRRRSSELVTAGENYDQLKCNQASALGFLSSLRGDTEWADGQQIFERMWWKKTRNQLCFRYMYTNSKSLSLIIFIYKHGEVSAEEEGSCKAIECIIKTKKQQWAINPRGRQLV